MISLQVPDTGYGVMAFGVCPTTFWSCFDSVFPQYAFIPHIYNGNIIIGVKYNGSTTSY